MRIKIFVPNEYGRIELTKEELEKLLNESYQQGWSDKPERPYYYYQTSYPYATYCSSGDTANSITTKSASNTTVLADEAMDAAKEEIKNTMESAYKVELE